MVTKTYQFSVEQKQNMLAAKKSAQDSIKELETALAKAKSEQNRKLVNQYKKDIAAYKGAVEAVNIQLEVCPPDPMTEDAAIAEILEKLNDGVTRLTEKLDKFKVDFASHPTYTLQWKSDEIFETEWLIGHYKWMVEKVELLDSVEKVVDFFKKVRANLERDLITRSPEHSTNPFANLMVEYQREGMRKVITNSLAEYPTLGALKWHLKKFREAIWVGRFPEDEIPDNYSYEEED